MTQLSALTPDKQRAAAEAEQLAAECARCGSPFVIQRKRSRGRHTKFCSNACRDLAHAAQLQAHGRLRRKGLRPKLVGAQFVFDFPHR